jgi:hypothetical protein
VSDDGTVRVTIPRWGSKREAVQFVDDPLQLLDLGLNLV